ncbi:PH domain-containing protein [Viridibacillus sp. NPDC096237]|uniref:PH domain-containing protein n=1 Tax=Viridibacillus sp. NPDC096237 TaxID=3390721 RepID=UPI003CFD88CC
MYLKIEAPQRSISKEAVKVWRITETLANAGILTVLGILYYLHMRFEWKEWIGWIILGVLILTVLFAIWEILFEPALKQKYWRYDVDENFIQLKYGALKEVNELVPMTKVQSVELNQGPFLRKYGLYSIQIGTMGSGHAIPAISEKEAFELRDQIAHYAKIKEVE